MVRTSQVDDCPKSSRINCVRATVEAKKEETICRATIALLNWNGGHFVRPCIESLLAQTEPALEIVVVDNGSTDSSLAEIRKLLSNSERSTRIHSLPNNRGISGGLQVALDDARGKYFFPFASDDVMLPKRVKLQCDQLDAANEHTNISAGAVRLIGPDGKGLRSALGRRIIKKPKNYGSPQETRRKACLPIVPPAPGLAFRTEALRRIGGYDPDAPVEDLDIFMRLVLCSNSEVVTSQKTVSLYRQHSSNSSKMPGLTGNGLEYSVQKLIGLGIDFGKETDRWRLFLDRRSNGYQSPWGLFLRTLRDEASSNREVRNSAWSVVASTDMSLHRRIRAVLAYVVPRFAQARVRRIGGQ